MDEVRNRIANLLGILGSRGLRARDIVLLLAEAAWDATKALRQHMANVRPRMQQEVESVQGWW